MGDPWVAVPAALNTSATKVSLRSVLSILISKRHYNLGIITDFTRAEGTRAGSGVLQRGEETQLVSKCVGCYGDLMRDLCGITQRAESFSLLGASVRRK